MVKIAVVTQSPTAMPQRNPDPNLPFARAREYQRAVNAAKIAKIYARPFIAALPGHSDGISCLAKCPLKVQRVVSGAYDGEIRVWDLAERKTTLSLVFHERAVKGLTLNTEGSRFLSSSDDKTVNLYDYASVLEEESPQPLLRFLSKVVLTTVDHSRESNRFVTAGGLLQVWDYERSRPVSSQEWGASSVILAKYNQSEKHVVACTGMDCSVMLFDLRSDSPLQKIAMPNKSRCLSWNPQEPLNFAVGNDDANIYHFDMRTMSKPLLIQHDFIAAVMDLDFAPTGAALVAGSTDKTVRIWDKGQVRSREVYHGKRMQQVSAVLYSTDSQFVISASEDMNLRMWRAEAAKPPGVQNERHKAALEYREALLGRYKYTQEVNSIVRHRHLPKYILNEGSKRKEQRLARRRREQNRRASAPWQFEEGGAYERKVERVFVEQR